MIFFYKYYLSLGDELQNLKDLKKHKQAHHKIQIPLGGKKTGHFVAHSFISLVTSISFWETCDPYKDGSMSFTMFGKVYLGTRYLWGSQKLHFCQNRVEHPLVCSQNCTKQQANKYKICPKTL
jgi:hypothetical protein